MEVVLESAIALSLCAAISLLGCDRHLPLAVSTLSIPSTPHCWQQTAVKDRKLKRPLQVTRAAWGRRLCPEVFKSHPKTLLKAVKTHARGAPGAEEISYACLRGLYRRAHGHNVK